MVDWRFLLDENVDPATVEELDAAALNAEHVRDALGEGADDRADVLPYARETGRIVVNERHGPSTPSLIYSGVIY